MTFEYHSLNENFAVAPQLSPEDMQVVANRGFKSVIINRPDFEGGADQPASATVMAAAKAAGLNIAYQPVISGSIGPDDVTQFAQLLKSLPSPILAFCRSGTRSANLYQAAVNIELD